MNVYIITITLIIYFLLLLAISHITKKDNTNDAFFRGHRKSPWYLVAFGMIGASISGVSFISVPGYVGITQMTYLQMCIGFFFGYIIVAYVLLPIYYRRNLTSIYSYLSERFGKASHKTGASFFILSKMTRACASFYIACIVLQQFIFSQLGIPFDITIIFLLFFIWIYTRHSGIRTLVYTDIFQTFCMLLALITIIIIISKELNLNSHNFCQIINQSPLSRIFIFNDWQCKQSFWKQFFSGIFIVIVMTGLDQDMMQKNLTCKNLKEAQKDMCVYGFCFIPVNILFLILGILLYLFTNNKGIIIPQKTDNLFPMLVNNGYFGDTVTILFIIGVTSAAFSSVDSALTALTTTICIDLLNIEQIFVNNKQTAKTRHWVHISVVFFFFLFMFLFKSINNTSIIDAIYTMASYTYGPLLGLFTFGLFTKRVPRDKYVPPIAILSPIFCYVISIMIPAWTGYHFGYELLMLNGALTFFGLYSLSLYSCPLKKPIWFNKSD